MQSFCLSCPLVIKSRNLKLKVYPNDTCPNCDVKIYSDLRQRKIQRDIQNIEMLLKREI